MIVDKIYEYLDKKDKEINENLLNEFKEEVGYCLSRQFLQEREERPTLRVSSLGKCLRQQYYRVKYPEEAEPLQPRTKFTFFFGDLVEAMIVALAKIAGVNLFDEQKEIYIDEIKGHIDGLIEVEDETLLFECKSMSDYSFKQFQKEGMTDDWGYLTQINSYLYALGLDRAVLVGVNKNTGHLHEEVIVFDEKKVKEIQNNITVLKKSITENNPPEKKYKLEYEMYYKKPTGNYKLPVTCAYCSYKHLCWDNIITAMKNGKPIFYVGGIKKLIKGVEVVEQ